MRNSIRALVLAVVCVSASGTAFAASSWKETGTASSVGEDFVDLRGQVHAELSARCEAQGATATGFRVVSSEVNCFYQAIVAEVSCVKG
ncbi:hypothetical protein [Lysobacter sp. CA199]|uniref:hypothetical protein n=1 Tax=Lysobacter sp. CA199 TaxID=3455608 RepID=UPI003F8D09E6